MYVSVSPSLTHTSSAAEATAATELEASPAERGLDIDLGTGFSPDLGLAAALNRCQKFGSVSTLGGQICMERQYG
jgi:hypothetical protein